MKPYGLTANFKVLKPTHAEDKIWEAVVEAIIEGWSPQRFKAEAAQAWKEELINAGKDAQRILEEK